uniref:DUF4502 domain-containing protein n=1 Tax=Ursus americanus TaxID=9643 RepID=A0A452RJS9_URSAM
MPRSSSCSGWKRKRNWDVEYLSFPRWSSLKFGRAGLRAVGAAAFLSEAWLRCGEGFQDNSGTLSLTAEKKIVTEKHLELSPRPKKLEWQKLTRQETTNVGKDMEKGDPSYTVGENASWYSHFGKQCGGPLKS